MYATRPLSLYQNFTGARSEKLPVAPYSGYLVVTDEESESQEAVCWGMFKKVKITKLPFPQDMVLKIIYTSNRGRTYTTKVWFIPVLDQPLSSNRYYVIKAVGKYKGTIVVGSRIGRSLSTGPNKVDEPCKVEEAETVEQPLPPSEKLLVLGGNGFVGSHVCKEAVKRGLTVSSLSRSGRPSGHELWVNNVFWHQGDVLFPESLKDAMNGVTSVISCIGGFGSNSQMYKINGTANINAIRTAAERGVKRFVYISAADFGVVNYLLQGYYEGKRAAETELMIRFPYGGVILRPGFIHGTRQVGSIKLPLGVIGAPLEMVLQHAKPLKNLPLVGSLFTPPVNVNSVARVAVRAATDPVFPPGIVDVGGILRYSQQKLV